MDLPYLPQLPMRDPAELMVPQALEGLPGLGVGPDGTASVRLAAWEPHAAGFEQRLERALASGDVSGFEPSATSSCAWRPFLREIEARKLPLAKLQCAGPVTACWALELDDGRPAATVPRLEGQVYRLVLARAIAMSRALRERGTRPLLFLDEPVLGLLEPERDPRHALLFEGLRGMIAALQQEGALVGVHCCGNCDWKALLGLGLEVLSFDAGLSLASVLGEEEALLRFVEAGGTLALGIVPTNREGQLDPELLAEKTLASLRPRGELGERLLRRSLLTPACGLALRSVNQCERVFAGLQRAQEILRASLAAG